MPLQLTSKQHDALARFFKKKLLTLAKEIRVNTRRNHGIHDIAYLAFFQGLISKIARSLETIAHKPLNEMIVDLKLDLFSRDEANQEQVTIACNLMDQLLTPICTCFYTHLNVAHRKFLDELHFHDSKDVFEAFRQLEINVENQPEITP